MAKAPTPGKGPAQRQQEEQEIQSQSFRITYNSESYVLNTDDLGPEDDRLARAQTQMPVSTYFNEGQIGTDTAVVLYWLARRKSGEKNLRYADVEVLFPNWKSMAALQVEEIDEEEASSDDAPLASEEN